MQRTQAKNKTQIQAPSQSGEGFSAIVITVNAGDGEEVLYPEELSERLWGAHMAWDEYQQLLAEFLKEYKRVCEVFDDEESITYIVYKRI